MSGGTTGPAGAKRRPAPAKRLVSFHLTLAQEERDALRAVAVAEGVTMARYIVEKALTGESPTARRGMRGELQTVRRQLVGVAANLNTATRVLHVTGDGGPLERMAAQVEATLRHVDAVLGGLR